MKNRKSFNKTKLKKRFLYTSSNEKPFSLETNSFIFIWYSIYLILLIQSNFQLRRFELSTLELQVWWVFFFNSFIIHNQTISTSLTINLNNLANKLHFPLWPPHLLVMNINSLIWFCYLLMDERLLIFKKIMNWTSTIHTTFQIYHMVKVHTRKHILRTSREDITQLAEWQVIRNIYNSTFMVSNFNLFQFVHPWCQAMIMCTFCPGEFKFHFYQLRISQVLKTATFDSKLNQYII